MWTQTLWRCRGDKGDGEIWCWVCREAGGVFEAVARRSVPNRFDSYIQRQETEIEKRRICSVILLQFVHILGKEQERGRGSGIGRVPFLELHELIVERRSYFNGETSYAVLD